MAKYCGKIGYVISEPDPDRPDIYVERVVERTYRGDIERIISNSQSSENLVGDFKLNMEATVVADAFAFENFAFIKYATYMNSKWEVSSVQVRYPRLILDFGGVYSEESK